MEVLIKTYILMYPVARVGIIDNLDKNDDLMTPNHVIMT